MKAATAATPRLRAQSFDSGFSLAHDTYNGMGAASDGNIYYVLCSESIDIGGQMHRYDPAAGKTSHVGDLTEACGEKWLKTIPQGKSHVNFVESEGKLYFATHIGYYTIIDGMETVGVPKPGYGAYPGGHFLSYDLASGEFEDLGIAPHSEGILTMAMDTDRGLLYGITWPKGYFFRLDLATRTVTDLGPVSGEGEAGRGPDYRTLCRSIVIRPEDGAVFFTDGEGSIFRYDPLRNRTVRIEEEDMRKDYFGSYDPASPGHMGYNWRQTFWYPPEKAIYGIHGNSGYLFRFDPAAPRLELVERLTSVVSRRSGMFDQFSYGYLGFALGPDRETIFYLTGGTIYLNGKRVSGKTTTATGEAKGEEDLHLVTYHIPSGRYADHGAVFLEDGQRPTWVNSIAVGKDESVYTLARVKRNGAVLADLIRIPRPSTL